MHQMEAITPENEVQRRHTETVEADNEVTLRYYELRILDDTQLVYSF